MKEQVVSELEALRRTLARLEARVNLFESMLVHASAQLNSTKYSGRAIKRWSDQEIEEGWPTYAEIAATVTESLQTQKRIEELEGRSRSLDVIVHPGS
ncbi:MAG: hypothetical protein OXD46_14960 [Chloroflexi bacterium]|nr:hypothetical protein [Chloroflexota bacterium]